MPHPTVPGSCRDFRRRRRARRDLLRIGALGVCGGIVGVGPRAIRLVGAEPQRSLKVRAKSVILLHQWGGPSHLDTFDMKPHAPQQIRGEFQPISTAVPGLAVCERLPRMSEVMDRFTVVRSVHHTIKNHAPAGYYSLTGHAPPTDDQRLRDTPELYPGYGAVVDRFAPAPRGVPTFVSYPHVIRDGTITPGQRAGFLGKRHDPLHFGNDPNSPHFRLPELSLPENLSPERLSSRRAMQRLIDRQTSLLETSATAQGIDAAYETALSMLTSPRVKQSFDLSAEPDKLRDAYGRTTYGQGCLLARRLVEAGVRFVNVYFSQKIGGCTGGWDTHGFNDKPMYPILKNFLCPVTDHTVPTLVRDLEDRGLLDQTLVVWMGEFGRTPKINAAASRDHWPQCYSVLLAGGGIRAGHVYGVSDKQAASPARDAIRPDDLAATCFTLLGIDPTTEVHDQLNRPLPISGGRVIDGLLA